MKATIKDTVFAAFICINLLALPVTAKAGQDEHQRYLIQKALKAKHEAKQEQVKQNKQCDESANASEKDKQSSK